MNACIALIEEGNEKTLNAGTSLVESKTGKQSQMEVQSQTEVRPVEHQSLADAVPESDEKSSSSTMVCSSCVNDDDDDLRIGKPMRRKTWVCMNG